MQPLIDGDILVYEIGYAAECGWRGIHEGEEDISPPPFDYTADLLEKRIMEICNAVGYTENPIIYLSGSTNFREEIAITKGYKENRDPEKKPYHYKNLKAHLKQTYHAETVEFIEADDMMGVEQVRRGDETIICSRDKDLRMIPGWHYSWELGRQPSFGPEFVEDPGWLMKMDKKILGVGWAFFCYQLLVGDRVDNIPGFPGIGPVKGYSYLKECTTKEDYFSRVEEVYRNYGDNWEEYLDEQGKLLWIIRHMNDDQPQLWSKDAYL